MSYHGNLLDTEFKDPEFLNSFNVFKKGKSRTDPWVHYFVDIPDEKLEENIAEIQKNLLSQKYYTHLYNEDGSEVIVILPDKIFRLSIDDRAGWREIRDYMINFGIPEHQTDPNPKRFTDEEDYFKRKLKNNQNLGRS